MDFPSESAVPPLVRPEFPPPPPASPATVAPKIPACKSFAPEQETPCNGQTPIKTATGKTRPAPHRRTPPPGPQSARRNALQSTPRPAGGPGFPPDLLSEPASAANSRKDSCEYA